MPVVEVHLLEGYESEARRRLAESLTDAVRLVIPAPPEAVTVMLHESRADNYFRGRITRTPAPALPDPCEQVQQFLERLGERDLEGATAFLATNASLHFPGAAPMSSLNDMVDWARARYRSIHKTLHGTEALQSAGDETVVFCRGTLSGTWLDGSSFEGVRFVDRFELIEGKITRQDVWNDLALHAQIHAPMNPSAHSSNDEQRA